MSTRPTLTPLQQATVLVKELRSRLDAAERKQRAPIAVVGASCRLPGGADSPERYWSLLETGETVLREIPPERWDVERYYDPKPGTPGKSPVRRAGLLDSIDGFDAGFFGISPREAAAMDPQQRLLLELSWHALEDAAISPDAVRGTRAGVFVASGPPEYGTRRWGELEKVDQYLAMGNAIPFVSGRLSYFLGLNGPSVTLDTACSSSLVAIHLACQSLRAGDCELALVGAAQLLTSPFSTVVLSRMGALSPEGRCKTFDASADGFGRGEGGVVFVLKRLDQAERDGDRILGLIAGSALSHDGRSGGLTVPNGIAQQNVIRDALAHARKRPEEIAYVEAHGTGTPLGDPIELNALEAVFSGPRAHKLWVGSMKTNLGHLEAAAGAAGLLKTLLALEKRTIPPHVNFERPTAHLAGGDSCLAVPVRPERLEGEALPAAGVSAFGLSGTNCHVVVQAAPPRPSAAGSTRSHELLLVSARNEQDLRNLAGALADHLAAHPSLSLADVSRTLATGRAAMPHRAAVVAADLPAAIEALRSLHEGAPTAAVVTGIASERPPRIGYAFTGQGAQAPGMGQRLDEDEPAFRRELDRFEPLFEARRQTSLRELMFGASPEGSEPLHQTENTQPAVFALELGAARALETFGIRPSAVLGHSLGEFAAAAVAEVLSPEEAFHLVCARGEGMRDKSLPGGMLSIALPASEVEARLRAFPGLSLTAINGPKDCGVAGDVESVERLKAQLAAEGIRVQRLPISIAAHSPLIEPMLDDLEAFGRTLTFRSPTVPLISNVTGRPVDAARPFDAAYLRAHAREPVRFSDAIDTLAELGVDVLLEIGPHPVLSVLASRCPRPPRRAIPTLRRGMDAEQALLLAVGSLWTEGCEVSLASRLTGAAKVALPGYPFHRTRHWIPVEEQNPVRHVEVADSPEEAVAVGLAPTGLDLPMLIEAELRRVLGLSRDARLAADVGFFDLGMDSIMSVELKRALEQRLGVELPATLALECPNLGALIEAVGRLVDGTEPAAPAAEIRASSGSDEAADSIAIVGMSCRFPGGANDLDSYWQLLAEGRDAVCEVPPDRWDAHALYHPDPDTPGKITTRSGGFLSGVDITAFDAEFFGISAREAAAMDPQHRLLLEVTAEALEHAGADLERLRGSRAGVFIGMASADYMARFLIGSPEEIELYATSGNAHSVAAGRIAYWLGTHGPALTVDTACSSSLVAAHQACTALREKECDLAVVGGVNLLLEPTGFLAFSRARALASDGRCKPFDARADGYGRGEGCGVLVLKRLRDAVRDGDRVLARIAGTAVNHDGRTSGLTVPSSRAQRALIEAALARAGLPVEAVDFIEAHGTGTPLGDPIEASAIRDALLGGGRRSRPLYVGSVKSNLSHLESAAGVAGVIKAVLALQAGQIPPNANFEAPNPRIDWGALDARVPVALTPWRRHGSFARTAGVSSFGMSGTNAHLVLQEAQS